MSTEEVKKLLDLLEKTSSRRSDSDIEVFIQKYGLVKGLDRVPTHVITYLYFQLHKGILRSDIELFRQFKETFEQVRTGKQRYYLIDLSVSKIDKVLIEEAKFYDREKKEARKRLPRRKAKSKIT